MENTENEFKGHSGLAFAFYKYLKLVRLDKVKADESRRGFGLNDNKTEADIKKDKEQEKETNKAEDRLLHVIDQNL